MKAHRREPKLAFVFEAQPGLISIPSRGTVEYTWFADQFHFPSGDPLSLYVTQNMTFITDFKLQDRIIVRCFIDDSSALDILKKEYEQDSTDPELNTQLGIIYEKRGDLNQAALYYKKAIAKNPKFIQALNQLAAVYKKQGNSEASLDTIRKLSLSNQITLTVTIILPVFIPKKQGGRICSMVEKSDRQGIQ